MKCKNFEIVKEITPYVAIKGDDYYFRQAVNNGDIEIFKHIFALGTHNLLAHTLSHRDVPPTPTQKYEE